MATIALCMWPMASEINGSLKLARTLTRHGHEVVYIGVPDCRPIVEKNGHRFVSILERWLPQGSLSGDKADYQRVRSNPAAQLLQGLAHKRAFEKLLRHLLTTRDNEVERAIRSIDPQLFVVGAHTSHTSILGFIALKLGVRCTYLLQQMLIRDQRSREGVESTDQPRSSIRRRFSQALFESFNINYRKYYREFLEQSGAPAGLIDHSNTRFPLQVPILYPWPRPFELEEVRNDQLTYIEAGVDLKRCDGDFPWERLEEGKALVYCSFGDLLPQGLKATRALLDTVVESLRPLTGCQMVLSLGPFFREQEFSDVPSNVVLVRRAPQIALLEKASLMITHGGSSSVKECILTAVPMIVIPLGYETPEYAERVRRHRLGLACDPSILTERTLARMIKRVLADESIRKAVRGMQAAFRKWESETPSVRFLQAYLESDPVDWRAIASQSGGLAEDASPPLPASIQAPSGC